MPGLNSVARVWLFLLVLYCLALTLAFFQTASAQLRPSTRQNKGDLRIPLPKIVLPERIPGLIRGQPLKAASFSAKGCTVTLIGPQVAITAAHCVQDGKRLVIERSTEVGAKLMTDTIFDGECRVRNDYDLNRNYTADFALCYSEVPIPEKKVDPDKPAIFERLGLGLDWLRIRPRVLMTGYGCVNPDSTGADGIDRGAPATVIVLGQILDGGVFANNGALWLNSQIITLSSRITDGVLCAGDSGGPTFFLYEGSAHRDGRRAIVAINSGNIISGGRVQDYSFLASTSSAAFRSFLLAWLSRYPQAQICGLGRPQDQAIEPRCHK